MKKIIVASLFVITLSACGPNEKLECGWDELYLDWENKKLTHNGKTYDARFREADETVTWTRYGMKYEVRTSSYTRTLYRNGGDASPCLKVGR